MAPVAAGSGRDGTPGRIRGPTPEPPTDNGNAAPHRLWAPHADRTTWWGRGRRSNHPPARAPTPLTHPCGNDVSHRGPVLESLPAERKSAHLSDAPGGWRRSGVFRCLNCWADRTPRRWAATSASHSTGVGCGSRRASKPGEAEVNAEVAVTALWPEEWLPSYSGRRCPGEVTGCVPSIPHCAAVCRLCWFTS